jgi:hypothetical protein
VFIPRVQLRNLSRHFIRSTGWFKFLGDISTNNGTNHSQWEVNEEENGDH